jgi:deoxyribodipyrimidine photo-lyase
MRSLVWFRGKDLRLLDHAPLRDAAAAGEVIPLFVLDPYFFEPARAAELPHRMQFLLESLAAVERALVQRGSGLVLARGKSVEVVPRLATLWKVDRILAHRWVEPVGRQRDERIRGQLGSKLTLYEGETLMPPGTLRTQSGAPYAVLSQFARTFRQTFRVGTPLAAPGALPPLPTDVQRETATVPSCEELGIVPNQRLLAGGEGAAHDRLHAFLNGRVASYAGQRDRMDLAGTSRLSCDLKFGTLSVRKAWTAALEVNGDYSESVETFQNELIWREFAYSTLWDRPELLEQPFRRDFIGFPWRSDDEQFRAWTLGKTGYPLVDAAARQLLEEGFVHNRARMVAASFLSKHLLIDYRRGERHYLRYLTDGDLANNNLGWQWSAGCGCDAQPYFRVLSPVMQGERFDPHGDYVRRWVPELADVPEQFIHRPWEAPADVLARARVRLGYDYPLPIVDHRFARERFLTTAARHLEVARAARTVAVTRTGS